MPTSINITSGRAGNTLGKGLRGLLSTKLMCSFRKAEKYLQNLGINFQKWKSPSKLSSSTPIIMNGEPVHTYQRKNDTKWLNTYSNY